MSVQGPKTSNLEIDLLHYPEKVVIYRKMLDRKSAGHCSKSLMRKLIRITNNTYITDERKVIRKNHKTPKPKFKSVHCSDLGSKTPAASTPRNTLYRGSSTKLNTPPVHSLRGQMYLRYHHRQKIQIKKIMTNILRKLDKLPAKTRKLYISLTKISKKIPSDLAARYKASPNVLRNIPSGGI